MLIVILLTASLSVQASQLGSPVPSWYIRYITGDDAPSGKEPEKEKENGTSLVDIVVLENDGHTVEGGSSDVSFVLEQEGIQGIIVSLKWQDDIGSNDEIGITLSYNGKEVETAQGTSGALDLEFTDGNETYFTGDYSIKVSAIDCPGSVTGLPIDRDNGNDWTLKVTIMVLE